MNKNAEKVMFQVGINALGIWLEKKGWELDIDYCNKDEMFSDAKQVFISSRQGVENQLYSLLHECGHILIQQNKPSYEKNYPVASKAAKSPRNFKQIEKTKKYKLDLITEEIDAWKRGKSLAERLGIHLNERKYNELAASCVHSYMEWATK
mgnify:FL=1|jgi:hypothetical protein|tara:strand:+ start:195 stop:647 length:453 start_codon:yes stop_codon:yes gene_type:complete